MSNEWWAWRWMHVSHFFISSQFDFSSVVVWMWWMLFSFCCCPLVKISSERFFLEKKIVPGIKILTQKQLVSRYYESEMQSSWYWFISSKKGKILKIATRIIMSNGQHSDMVIFRKFYLSLFMFPNDPTGVFILCQCLYLGGMIGPVQ